MLSSPEELHDYSMLMAFVTLCESKQLAEAIFERNCYGGLEFYLFVMIPNKPVTYNSDVWISSIREQGKRFMCTNDDTYDIDSDDIYQYIF